ncbi:2-oxo acid dehydrogenase subunit E2 [Candidatus Atribacteria bacterium 1244-E10-H5-B2]|nr:MAG: 2-oxo acid dehydrogenase subunit E2 [Candidatus Atribacteria bacterium 1244-E10-H5-B2]
MAVNVTMPKNGMTMTEGVITRWYKKMGETIKEGEAIAEIMTDKITIELEAPASGVVTRIFYPEESTVPIYEVIAVIGGEKQNSQSAERSEMPEDSENYPQPVKEVSEKEKQQQNRIIRATPLAKRSAKKHGIDLILVPGSGPKGRIKEEDVLKYIDSQKVSAAQDSKTLQTEDHQKTMLPIGGEEVIPLVGMRKTIAENMRHSHDVAVHVTSTIEVDLTELISLRKRLLKSWEEHYGVHLTLNAFFVKAVAVALRSHPILNSSLTGDKIIIKKYYNIGLAVSVDDGDGLIVPVIRNVEKLTIREIAEQMHVLTQKAHTGKLTLDDITGGTFTISNVGPQEVQVFTPVIVQPQSAILGIGTITLRPVVREGEIIVRSMSNLCLTYDHRIILGVPATQFQLAIKYLLENPYGLLS